MTELVADKLPDLAMPFDPPADRRDPYPDYARHRRDTPVILSDTGGALPLAWVFRHADVATVLQDHGAYSNAAARVFLGPTLGEDLLVGMDPPDHQLYRRLVMPSFSPASLAGWKALIGETVDEILGGIAASDSVDLVRDLSFVLPAKIMSRILGLPEADFEKFRGWAMDIITVAGDPATALASAGALRAYLDPIIEDRRSSPRNDLITGLVTAQVDGDALSHQQIQSFLLTLLPAGIETTYRSLGNLLHVLLSTPSHWSAIVEDSDRIRPAIEEILRFEAPLQVVFRTAIADHELAGVKIAKGTFVIPVLGSANRDETAHADSDMFMIGRTARNYLTFGKGVHTCVGLHLAKMEMVAAIEALARRFPGLQLDGDKASHIRGLMVRSPASVPVMLA